MTRFKSLFAAAVASAIVAVVPAASAQNVHFVGAGSSAQFLMAAIAADQAALNENSAVYGGGNTVQHWTKKNAAFVSDNRDTLGRITNEVGNVWLVWIKDGSGNVTDVWTDVSVDSTVGVRTFSAQENIGGVQTAGGQVQITSTSGTASDNLVSPNSPFSALWPDNTADVPVTANALASINSAVAGGAHVNVGLTDIRPEDAQFATNRAIAALNTTTYAGLGYVGVTGNIGAPINSGQPTSTANATPIKFALQGKGDPFKTAFIVPPYTTIPIGAAPIIFIANNNSNSSFPKNLVSGVTPGLHLAGNPPLQTYPLEELFAGKVPCDTDASAFGGTDDGGGTPLTVFLREPLSGTMNTTEFSLFRSFGDNGVAPGNSAYGTQETGVINPTRAPYNPLNLGCPTDGSRSRAIGTGEVVGKAGAGGLIGTPNSIGYIFYGFSNAAKLTGAGFNYLTIDGVDPLALPGTVNQELPNCSGTVCPASLWTGSLSYPHLRDGTYKAWSIYRWLVYNSNLSDPYGPADIAQLAQDFVDQDVADFVPFATSTGSDGLEVYRSHYTQSAIVANNGSKTTANSLDNGNALGGGAEAGGDMGGLIQGPFGTTLATTNGQVEWFATSSTIDTKVVYKVTWKAGPKFTAGTAWVGSTITLGGSPQTITNCLVGTTAHCNPTATTLYVLAGNPSGAATEGIAVTYSAPFSITYPAANTPGILQKKQ
jgi:hypothetical protein